MGFLAAAMPAAAAAAAVSAGAVAACRDPAAAAASLAVAPTGRPRSGGLADRLREPAACTRCSGHKNTDTEGGYRFTNHAPPRSTHTPGRLASYDVPLFSAGSDLSVNCHASAANAEVLCGQHQPAAGRLVPAASCGCCCRLLCACGRPGAGAGPPLLVEEAGAAGMSLGASCIVTFFCRVAMAARYATSCCTTCRGGGRGVQGGPAGRWCAGPRQERNASPYVHAHACNSRIHSRLYICCTQC